MLQIRFLDGQVMDLAGRESFYGLFYSIRLYKSILLDQNERYMVTLLDECGSDAERTMVYTESTRLIAIIQEECAAMQAKRESLRARIQLVYDGLGDKIHAATERRRNEKASIRMGTGGRTPLKTHYINSPPAAPKHKLRFGIAAIINDSTCNLHEKEEFDENHTPESEAEIPIMSPPSEARTPSPSRRAFLGPRAGFPGHFKTHDDCVVYDMP